MAENIRPAKQPTSSKDSPARSKALRGRSVRAAQDDIPSEAVQRRDPNRAAVALEYARVAARIADDNRARDILLLDLRMATPLVDFFVIVTATSRRQSHAIASEIDAEMKKRGERKLGLEGSEEGRWILIDYGDFVVHIFSGEGRSYYALEDIWGDAPRLGWDAPEPRKRTAHSAAEPAERPAPEEPAETDLGQDAHAG
jgi:ribosome-associated protein